jgi:hypothetical protein
MGIDGMPLNTGPLSHHADDGERWADAAVQIDRGFHNFSARLCLLLGAALEDVGSGHIDFVVRARAFNIDTPPILSAH